MLSAGGCRRHKTIKRHCKEAFFFSGNMFGKTSGHSHHFENGIQGFLRVQGQVNNIAQSHYNNILVKSSTCHIEPEREDNIPLNRTKPN